MPEEMIRIPVDERLSLEGGYTPPSTPQGPAALILHPHPLYGGSMLNNVVEALLKACGQCGWGGLRINFRGVGGSGGSYGQGIAEKEDVLAAAKWLNGQGISRLGLMGYSFGALVGSRAAGDLAGLACGVWVSPPFMLGPLSSWPQDAGPLLLLSGDHDEYCPLGELNTYFQGMSARAEKTIIEGADHFHWGRESELIGHVAEFLRNLS